MAPFRPGGGRTTPHGPSVYSGGVGSVEERPLQLHGRPEGAGAGEEHPDGQAAQQGAEEG